MDSSFWNERWQKGDIAFHRPQAQELLVRHWGNLGFPVESVVLVPLCGKSVDMLWLAERGHRVIGVELSEIAVDAFFADRGLVPTVRSEGGFTVKSVGAYEIWCGDFFELPEAAVSGVSAVYDRAALVAFPPSEQPRYASKLALLTPSQAPIVLIGLDFAESELKGPPFPASLPQIGNLFGGSHAINIVESRNGLEESPNLKARGAMRLEESLYVLRRNAAH
jgi:thiopurine S-methyltransferase